MRRMLLWLAIAMLGAVFPAAAGEVNIYACTWVNGPLQSYNTDDTNCATPKSSFVAGMGKCYKATLKCDTPSCQVKFWSDPCRLAADNYVIVGVPGIGLQPGTPANYPENCNCLAWSNSPVQ